MAIKAGQILHLMNRFVIDRIQTGGATLNIPQERIYELGNDKSVGIVRDTPDLTFTVDNMAVDTEIEGLLCGSADPGADAAGTLYDLSLCQPVDIVSPFKSAVGAYDVVQAIAVPQLTLESVSYRFGLRANATETYTLRGDSIYYVPGNAFVQYEAGDGTTTAFTFNSDDYTPTAMTALGYDEDGVTLYALNVSVNGVRMRRGVDYTDTATGISFTTAPATGAQIRIVFGSKTPRTANYAPGTHTTGGATNSDLVVQDTTVKPAAIRSKDIHIFINGVEWSDIQSVNADYRATLEDDYEFGNAHAVNRDYAAAPDITGSFDVKFRDVNDMFGKLQTITGVAANHVIGPNSSVLLDVRVELWQPNAVTKTVLKTLHCPDARFTLPGYEGRAQQKLTQTLPWQSETGILHVYKGAKTLNGQGI